MIKLLTTACLMWIFFIGHGQHNSLPGLEAYFSAIIVHDIDTSLHWYTDILGFEIVDKTESAERGFKQANLKREKIQIELIELDSAISQKDVLSNHSEKTKMSGFFKLGFLVTGFDTWIDRLKECDVHFHGTVVVDHISDKRTVIIKDPDGNRIQLFEK